jgi:AcrR family transcriptional regulator
VIENATLHAADAEGDVVARIAAASTAKRGLDYPGEVRRLLDAALEVMARNGTRAHARVADIVETAGLSNETFYRHFRSKDALVLALLEDGNERLAGYLAHQMSKDESPEGKIRRWVEGIFTQTHGDNAVTTLAVVWNGSGLGVGAEANRHDASAPLGVLLHEPLAELGSDAPELDAILIAHAVLGRVGDHLWAHTEPSMAEIDRIVVMCVAMAGAAPPTR